MSELNMKAVLRQTGLTADRLRVWERRYGAVRPARNDKGRRVYSDSEIQRIKLLALLVEQGHSIGTVANLSDEELLNRAGNSAHSKVSVGSEINELIESLARFDLEKIRCQLGLLRYTISPREFAFEVIPQIMFFVGKSVDAGIFTIAHEHALSEILQGHLKRIYDDLSELDGLRDEGTFLFCTREGDPHDFGLLMAAIAARSAGLRTHYVGKNLPVSALAEAVHKLKPRAIVLGMAKIPQDQEKIGAQEYLDIIHTNVNEKTEIWIGGSAAQFLKRPQSKRTIFIFETIADLESKLKILGPVGGTQK